MGIKKLQDIVDLLNNIDLDDLQNIDYKNLVINTARNRPDILINILLVVATVFYVGVSHSQNSRQLRDLQYQANVLDEKVALVDEFKSTQRKISEFIQNAPKWIPGEKLVATINDIAIASNVQIIVFSPGETIKSDLYERTSLRITATAQDYNSFWDFVKKLEDSEYAIQVNSWLGRINISQGRRKTKEIKNENITVNMEISATNIIKNEKR